MGVTTTGPLEIREDETDVLADGVRVGLTVREFEIFLALASHPDRVVQRPDIMGYRFSPEHRAPEVRPAAERTASSG
jgi:DNA-binding response OmpR family regulator